MTATSQHGFHPDAESLSAFSEQALNERERMEVLAHLAVCGRCRQVVALAREAADAGEVTAAARLRKTNAPDSWWKQWRLVWVPTAVVAAFAAASISVYIERSDRHGPDTKIAEQNPDAECNAAFGAHANGASKGRASGCRRSRDPALAYGEARALRRTRATARAGAARSCCANAVRVRSPRAQSPSTWSCASAGSHARAATDVSRR
jgi:hypothetical protein